MTIKEICGNHRDLVFFEYRAPLGVLFRKTNKCLKYGPWECVHQISGLHGFWFGQEIGQKQPTPVDRYKSKYKKATCANKW